MVKGFWLWDENKLKLEIKLEIQEAIARSVVSCYHSWDGS